MLSLRSLTACVLTAVLTFTGSTITAQAATPQNTSDMSRVFGNQYDPTKDSVLTGANSISENTKPTDPNTIFAPALTKAKTEYVTPTAQDKVEIFQGQKILVQRNNGTVIRCTIGLVNPYNNTVHTASHCLNDAKQVYVIDPKTRGSIAISNRFYLSDGFGKYSQYPNQPANDYALMVINLNTDRVYAGRNPLSGTSYINRPIRENEKVCWLAGHATKISCGYLDKRFTHTTNSAIAVTGSTTRGDSGGPAWLAGSGGFIGVISSYSSSKNMVWIDLAKNQLAPDHDGTRVDMGIRR